MPLQVNGDFNTKHIVIWNLVSDRKKEWQKRHIIIVYSNELGHLLLDQTDTRSYIKLVILECFQHYENKVGNKNYLIPNLLPG